MYSALTPRLLGWGTMLAGLGMGLMVASFVGEDTPEMGMWGLALLGAGASLGATYYILRRRGHGQ
ncbi:MAG: hypothetical protein HW388_613 [Dehalococcoidia bacterium]|nr:hypothetical protein [Dehalococcoidia bacterium]